MLRGAAIAVDSMAISSRVPTHFILPPVLLADKSGPAGGLFYSNTVTTQFPASSRSASDVPILCRACTFFVWLTLTMASVGDDVKKSSCAGANEP